MPKKISQKSHSVSTKLTRRVPQDERRRQIIKLLAKYTSVRQFGLYNCEVTAKSLLIGIIFGGRIKEAFVFMFVAQF